MCVAVSPVVQSGEDSHIRSLGDRGLISLANVWGVQRKKRAATVEAGLPGSVFNAFFIHMLHILPPSHHSSVAQGRNTSSFMLFREPGNRL